MCDLTVPGTVAPTVVNLVVRGRSTRLVGSRAYLAGRNFALDVCQAHAQTRRALRTGMGAPLLIDCYRRHGSKKVNTMALRTAFRRRLEISKG